MVDRFNTSEDPYAGIYRDSSAEFAEGVKARREGKPISQNPYVKTLTMEVLMGEEPSRIYRWKAQSWVAGWCDEDMSIRNG